jgi:predicted membrane protein
MSDSFEIALTIIIAYIVPATIAFYAAYWAFSIRRALAGRIYRSHALWLGSTCILLASTGLFTYSTNSIVNTVLGVYYGVLFVVLFAFVDSTVRVARRSDPHLRSILLWEKLRIVVWIDIAALEVFQAIFVIVPLVSPTFPNSPQGVTFLNIAGYLYPVFSVIPFVAGAPALLIGARRSRDTVLQGSLKWLGVVFALIVVSILEGNFFPSGINQFNQYYSYYAIPGGIIGILSAYAIYRSARSLAPMNRIQIIDQL